MGWIWGQLNESWKDLRLSFWRRKIQRRGAHVKPLEIGSRAGLLCFGGI
jgi:hypothetical protein